MYFRNQLVCQVLKGTLCCGSVSVDFWRSIDCNSGIDDARKIPETRIIFIDFGDTCPVCARI